MPASTHSSRCARGTSVSSLVRIQLEVMLDSSQLAVGCTARPFSSTPAARGCWFAHLLVDGFHYLALFAIGGSIVSSAAFAFVDMAGRGHASIADILLLALASLLVRYGSARFPSGRSESP